MKKEELKEILDKHLKWLENEEGGEHADLSGADLRYADLSGADLRYADLSGVNLRYVNLRDVNLRGINLSGADLSGADLRDVNLRYADLSGVNLSGAYLSDVNLRGVNLRGADLSGVNLSGTDLRGVNLKDVNLSGVNLSGAYLRGVNLSGIKDADKMQDILISHTSICPEGTIIGWKKCRNNVIVKLEIPAEAKRSNATGRKCRAEYAKVLEVIGAEVGISQHNLSVVYKAGEIIYPDKWDEDRWNECSHGIHFFITRLEAEKY
jgi:hypothetical protein